MSKKQTAVQWLIDELNEIGIRYLDLAEEQINKALQLEREQIEEAYQEGWMRGDYTSIYKAEYYEQTFKP